MTLVQIFWLTALVIVILLVPVAIGLLHRTLRAAWSIKGYLAEMEAAGRSIAGNTAAVGALQDTEAAAGGMLETTADLNQHSAALAGALSERAERGRLL